MRKLYEYDAGMPGVLILRFGHIRIFQKCILAWVSWQGMFILSCIRGESWPGKLSYDLRTFCYESLRFLLACFPCMLILDELADRRQGCHPQLERSRLLLLLMPKSLGRDPLERSLRVMTFPRTNRRPCMSNGLIAGRVLIC